jgi:hypothetical protein
LLDVTALRLSCCVPTLLRGSVAAYAVPPSAMNSAAMPMWWQRRYRSIARMAMPPSWLVRCVQKSARL